MTSEVKAMNGDQKLQAKSKLAGMPGFHRMPMNMIAIPQVRLVQPNSEETMLADGEHEARKGSFYYNNLQTTEDGLRIAILDTMMRSYTGPDRVTGEERTRQSLQILFLDLTFNKPYLMSIQPGSFSNWRNYMSIVMAEFEAGRMATSFSRETIVTSELVKNDKGSFYVCHFKLGAPVDDMQFATLGALWDEYGGYFDQAANAAADEG